jgi:hypothetical protein
LALNPELIKRRKRVETPRAPFRSLGERVKGLNTADGDLEQLLKELIALADRETLFTATMEFYPRLEAALAQAGYLFTINVNVENQIAPGAIVTTYLPIAPGYSFLPVVFEYFTSLPWWLTAAFWVDSDLPNPPNSLYLRTPDHFRVEWYTLARVQRFLRYTVTNNHAANTANFLASHFFDVVTDDTYSMIEKVYLVPLIEYVQEKAEKITGRPSP